MRERAGVRVSVKRGQAASFTVEVFTQNSPASEVSVTLAAPPSARRAAAVNRPDLCKLYIDTFQIALVGKSRPSFMQSDT